MFRFFLSIVLTLFLITSSFAQKDKTERKLVQSVDKHTAYYTDLLKELVNMNSGTMNF